MMIANTEQAEHWNSSDDVVNWVDGQAKFDGMLAPFVALLLDGAGVASTDRVLDLGCGCGATTRAAAAVATGGRAHGVDLSRPMLARARDVARDAGLANVTFEEADVQVHPFERGAFDVVISRFGIMFFADPETAFANVHRATRDGGRLAFVCWRALAENEWVVVPMTALAGFVPLPPPAAPGAPGMFAFADPDVPRRHLERAGWHDVSVEPVSTTLLVGGPGTLDDAVDFLTRGSMARAMLADADAGTRSRAIDAVRAALAPHVTDEGVRLGSGVWLVTAVA